MKTSCTTPRCIPDWLLKTGEPIKFAFANINGPNVVSQGVVTAHRHRGGCDKAQVYIVGSSYAFWMRPQDITQILDDSIKEGDFLPKVRY